MSFMSKAESFVTGLASGLGPGLQLGGALGEARRRGVGQMRGGRGSAEESRIITDIRRQFANGDVEGAIARAEQGGFTNLVNEFKAVAGQTERKLDTASIAKLRETAAGASGQIPAGTEASVSTALGDVQGAMTKAEARHGITTTPIMIDGQPGIEESKGPQMPDVNTALMAGRRSIEGLQGRLTAIQADKDKRERETAATTLANKVVNTAQAELTDIARVLVGLNRDPTDIEEDNFVTQFLRAHPESDRLAAMAAFGRIKTKVSQRVINEILTDRDITSFERTLYRDRLEGLGINDPTVFNFLEAVETEGKNDLERRAAQAAGDGRYGEAVELWVQAGRADVAAAIEEFITRQRIIDEEKPFKEFRDKLTLKFAMEGLDAFKEDVPLAELSQDDINRLSLGPDPSISRRFRKGIDGLPLNSIAAILANFKSILEKTKSPSTEYQFTAREKAIMDPAVAPDTAPAMADTDKYTQAKKIYKDLLAMLAEDYDPEQVAAALITDMGSINSVEERNYILHLLDSSADSKVKMIKSLIDYFPERLPLAPSMPALGDTTGTNSLGFMPDTGLSPRMKNELSTDQYNTLNKMHPNDPYPRSVQRSDL